VSVSAGRQLGAYQVLSPLGAGAMGEVWRARDGKLGREVAIKVLPEHFADGQRLLAIVPGEQDVGDQLTLVQNWPAAIAGQ
jgi:serine/threonine protein kinase